MKQNLSLFRILSIIALLAAAGGCATTESTENLLVAAGFKVVTPKTAAQQQRLTALPPGKVSSLRKSGKTYYIFPDVANNQAYVGGPKQYQAYQKLRLEKQMADEKLEAAEMDMDASMEWDAWGGWGMWGPGWY
jgi:hypothetical protein